MCLTKGFLALAIALVANGAIMAADNTASGKIKSINSDKKTFVVTIFDKDSTFKCDENLIVNRDGKESKSDLKVGDYQVCYDAGVVTWTAHYVLVQEGTFKNYELISGSVKGYDADKKELNFTNRTGAATAYPMGRLPGSREHGRQQNRGREDRQPRSYLSWTMPKVKRP